MKTTILVNQSVAILCDGPKGFWAMSLMFACASHLQLKLIALHNLNRHSKERLFFEQKSDNPVFYEEQTNNSNNLWSQLKQKEKDFCSRVGARRSLECSSLGVMPITNKIRKCLKLTFNHNFYLFQPPFIRWSQALGLKYPVHFLFKLSFGLWK